jgi:hypothetical protein
MSTTNGTLPISIRDRERFTPAHYGPDAAEAPVYLLAALTLAERNMLNRLVIGTCGMFVSTTELRDALREAAMSEYLPAEIEDVTTTLDTLEQFEGAKDADESVELMMKGYRTKIGRWQNELSRLPGGLRLRQLFATQLEQLETISLMGVRACLRDWEGLPTPCARKNGLVTEDAMQAIPERDFEALAERCLALREVTQAQEPGSASL